MSAATLTHSEKNLQIHEDESAVAAMEAALSVSQDLGTFCLYKRVKGDKGRYENRYLSVTGRWVKSRATAEVWGFEKAKEKAAEMGCFFKRCSYRL